MSGSLLSLVVIIVALAGGIALGWLLGSRPAAELRNRLAASETETRESGAQFRKAISELGEAQIALATLKANAANFDEQKAGLLVAQESLKAEFQAAGAKILAQAQETLLNRAQERMTQSEEKSAERLKALLAPVDQRLKAYEEQVTTLEKQRVEGFSQLAGVIEEVRKGQEEVRREAARLGNSLTNAPKARGRWGERALQNVLEQCGLSQHTDFNLEHSLDTEDGRLRPDAIVRIPGQKMLVIDAKVSLNHYQAAFEAGDDETRKRNLDLHARSMRGHVQTLGAKSYQSQFDEAPDYVVMFVPGEHFVAAALESDPDLWDFAFHNKVLLATPTNLVAIARTVAMVWQQDQLAREAIEIGKAGTELHERLRVAADHLKGVGANLDRAVRKYNDFVGSFERNVLTSGRRLKDRGVAIGKGEIEDVPLVESMPRYTAADTEALLLQDNADDIEAAE